MDPRAFSVHLTVAAPALAFLSGCAALGEPDGPPPLRPPEVRVEAHAHVGTSLTGPLPLVHELREAPPLLVEVSAAWVERPVVTSGDLASRASLVLGPGDAQPLRAIARRAGEVGFSDGEEALGLLDAIAAGTYGRTSRLFGERAPLSSGTTYRVRAEGADAADAPSFLLDATRVGDEVEARVALQLGLRGDDTSEKILLATPLTPTNGPCIFVLPRNAGRDEPAALVVSIASREEAIAGPTPETLDAAALLAADRRRRITRSEEEVRELASLLGDLDRPTERRARLVQIAGSCRAPLALDVALIANADDLEAFAVAIRAAVPAGEDRAGASWPIERAAWTFVGARAASGKIAPELSGVLARHGGEAARFPGAIEDLVRGVATVEAFTARLVAENRILLESGSPTSRARAFDWLVARGLEPAGFDPFGTLADRRAALKRAEEAAAPTVDAEAAPR